MLGHSPLSMNMESQIFISACMKPQVGERMQMGSSEQKAFLYCAIAASASLTMIDGVMLWYPGGMGETLPAISFSFVCEISAQTDTLHNPNIDVKQNLSASPGAAWSGQF